MRGKHDRLTAELLARGFTTVDAERKAVTLARCDAALDAVGASSQGRLSVWTPGRIELFGKHTDYAGGRSLLTAVERGFCLRAAPRADDMIRVADPSAGLRYDVSLGSDIVPIEGHWSNYVATALRRLVLNFPEVRTGVDIQFISDLPLAAGLSSSTALMISIFRAVAALNRLPETETWRHSLSTLPELAGYLGAMEMGGAFGMLTGVDGVGTLGGSQDQTAILCAEPNAVVDFGWMPVVRHGAYPLPMTHCFVVASSGVVAEKSGAAKAQYNRASLMVRHLLSSWNGAAGRNDRSLAAAMESDSDAPARLRAWIPECTTSSFTADALRHRLDQFLLETYTLIPAAARAFATYDWALLADVTAQSFHAANEWLGNQIDETRALVRLANANGAIAASAFGAGFGGSVWAFVAVADVAAFMGDWSRAYAQLFPASTRQAVFFSTSAAAPAAHWFDAVTTG